MIFQEAIRLPLSDWCCAKPTTTQAHNPRICACVRNRLQELSFDRKCGRHHPRLYTRCAVDAYNAVTHSWLSLPPLSSPRQKLAGALDESRTRWDEPCAFTHSICISLNHLTFLLQQRNCVWGRKRCRGRGVGCS